MADETINLIGLTSDIVSAYVNNNPLPVASLIHSVNLTPAVNPKKSVFPDYIVCLDDGKQVK